MNKNTRGIFCTLMGGILWGFSGACSDYLFTHYTVDSGWLTVVRMLGAGIVLTALNLTGNRINFRRRVRPGDLRAAGSGIQPVCVSDVH